MEDFLGKIWKTNLTFWKKATFSTKPSIFPDPSNLLYCLNPVMIYEIEWILAKIILKKSIISLSTPKFIKWLFVDLRVLNKYRTWNCPPSWNMFIFVSELVIPHGWISRNNFLSNFYLHFYAKICIFWYRLHFEGKNDGFFIVC